MAQDPRQPDGLVHRPCPTSEQFGGPHATYPPRAAFAAGQPQGCQVTLTVPGPRGWPLLPSTLLWESRPWQVMGLPHVVNSNPISSSM